MAVTGYLSCVCEAGVAYCLVGIVYCDARGRFKDGSTIRTSRAVARDLVSGYHVFMTETGSWYVACDWSPHTFESHPQYGAQ